MLLFILAIPMAGFTQDFNANSKGIAVKGYDVVAYFDGEAKEGSKEFQAQHEGTTFQFSNQANLDRFKANPGQFIPKYGGWCAYAMAKSGGQVAVNPKTFEVRDGKLYLFYNKGFTNTLKKWQANEPEKLRVQADQNWATRLAKK